MSHLWSLAVEEHAYLILPWVIRKITAKQLVRIGLVVVGLTAVFRLLALLTTHDCVAVAVLTPFRLDTICIGGLVACVPSLIFSKEQRVSLWNRGFAISALTLCAMIVTTHLFRGNIFVSTLGYPLLAANFACLIGLLVDGDRKAFYSLWLSNPLLIYLGTRSYAIYLFHLPVARYFNSILLLKRETPPLEAFLVGMVAPLAVTVLLSEISWRLLEKPILSFKKRFPR